MKKESSEGYFIQQSTDTSREIEDKLNELAQMKSIVSVWTGRGARVTFDTQVSVCGSLEKHTIKNQYRVLINTGTYAYFSPSDVLSLSVKHAGFQDGSAAVIELTF